MGWNGITVVMIVTKRKITRIFTMEPNPISFLWGRLLHLPLLFWPLPRHWRWSAASWPSHAVSSGMAEACWKSSMQARATCAWVHLQCASLGMTDTCINETSCPVTAPSAVIRFLGSTVSKRVTKFRASAACVHEDAFPDRCKMDILTPCNTRGWVVIKAPEM